LMATLAFAVPQSLGGPPERSTRTILKAERSRDNFDCNRSVVKNVKSKRVSYTP